MTEPVIVRSLRDLDALVAEKVMDWKPTPDMPGYGRAPQRPLSLIGQEYPEYSADISAAWQVIEKLGKNRQKASLQLIGVRWLVEFEHAARAAATAPLAICLTALKNEGIDVQLELEGDRPS
jgi:hypothetical protein